MLRIPDEEDIKVEVEEEIEHTAAGVVSPTTKKVEVLVSGRHLCGRMEMRNLGNGRLVDFFLWPKNMLS